MRTHSVIVHKANVPMLKNESLGAFCHALKSAAKAHLMQKYNVDDKKGSAYAVEVFADKAVFMVIPDYEKPSTNDFHVAFKFARATDGTFTFGETMKVQPVTSFIAADGGTAAVSKARGLGMDNWVKGGTFAGVI